MPSPQIIIEGLEAGAKALTEVSPAAAEYAAAGERFVAEAILGGGGKAGAFDKATGVLRGAGKDDLAKIVDGWKTVPGTLHEFDGSFVHSTAVIDADAVIRPGAIIGPHAFVHSADVAGVIDSRAIIGDDSIIMHNAYVGPNISIYPRGFVGQGTHLVADETSRAAEGFPKSVPLDLRHDANSGVMRFMRLLPGEIFKGPPD